MKTLSLLVILSWLPAMVCATNQTQSCPDFPYFKPETGPLAVLNCDMHHAYNHRVNQIMSTFGTPNGRPIILNLGGTLVLKYNGKVKTVDITPPPFQILKALSHGVFTDYLILSQQQNGSLTESTQALLNKLHNNLKQGLASVDKRSVSSDTYAAL